MGKIIELNQHIANQIAAGEVVERPLSVVKELIENAIDAGGNAIEIRIKDGGFNYIVVKDDGSGMDVDDVQLCVKRYATSKLQTVSDLDNLFTYGFRGEALPSIASISHMSIMSRMHNAVAGVEAKIEAGTCVDVTEAHCDQGTRIEVRNLFFNVPARLKFAKSRSRESWEIDRLIKSIAFIYPNIRWRLFIDDNLVLNYSNAVDNAAAMLLGADTKGHLFSVDKKTDHVHIAGVIASPMVVRRDARSMIFFVNGRLVNDRKLTMAVKMAYRTLLEVGRSPACALNIMLAPDEVDVNVHPRKSEVRFKDERRVISDLISVLTRMLSTTPWLASESEAFESKSETPIETMATTSFMPKPLAFSMNMSGAELWPVQKIAPAQNSLLSARTFSDLVVIGQLCSTYLVAESTAGLVVVDQHAAHERIMFEKIRCQKASSMLAQPLLIPFTLSLSPLEMTLFVEHSEDFLKLKFDVAIFGKDAIVVRALPQFLHHADIAMLIREMLSDFSELGRARGIDEIFDHVCATFACHASIRAGQRMSNDEIIALFKELDGTEFGAHCPHGRPIVKSIARSELKKWFDRN